MIELEKTIKEKKSIHLTKKKAKKKVTEKVNVVHSSFYDELQNQELEEYRLEFDKLVDEIIEQGERFAKNPTLAELKKYKSMIKQFLKHITDNMVRIEHYTGGKFRQKIYTLARIVDDRLKALSDLIMSNQIKNIDLMSKLDEIRGLLIDLYK